MALAGAPRVIDSDVGRPVVDKAFGAGLGEPFSQLGQVSAERVKLVDDKELSFTVAEVDVPV